jgi:hypothetical protein
MAKMLVPVLAENAIRLEAQYKARIRPIMPGFAQDNIPPATLVAAKRPAHALVSTCENGQEKSWPPGS